ncbi:TetR/AcrR family transcriptional regulator [Hydrogenophaga sp.]|uniref:TetR/AcrR family transcriptional regulator n=1 Tax=Hydrogenophaga sp. TaxID=1904254 RepID=UPI00261D08AE|nr:TetR/AcrR family transcriptional regulator [Hydrogenophaga sp.]MCW5653594.1 TetR/AcrR family transcriptional regulator [Hydrogenophaga sp.]
MPTTRDQIVDAADQLFYEQGFEHTSFAHIADAVRISRGNFYYHFKTKDEILDAVIAARMERTRQMLAQWAQQGDTPQARIAAFIDILARNRDKIMRHGCPVGTLCAEMAKLGHAAGQEGANQILALFGDWLARQFGQMGHRKPQARALALHLLARSQGVATLTNAFQDPAFVRHEVAQMHAWLAQQGAEPGPPATTNTPPSRRKA